MVKCDRELADLDLTITHLVVPGFCVGSSLDSAVMVLRRAYGKGICAGVPATGNRSCGGR